MVDNSEDERREQTRRLEDGGHDGSRPSRRRWAFVGVTFVVLAIWQVTASPLSRWTIFGDMVLIAASVAAFVRAYRARPPRRY